MTKKIKIAVLSGGMSNERDVSLRTGRQVFDNLSCEQYDKYNIEMTSEGRWLLIDNKNIIGSNSLKERSLMIMDPRNGITKNDLQQFDVVFLALHGKYGEDGKIQAVLDILKIPYTGSGVLASSLGMNKAMSKEFAKLMGIDVPKYILIKIEDNLDSIKEEVKNKIGYPCIVKPNESGSSIGVYFVEKEDNIDDAILNSYKESDQVIIEEYIKGRELSCGIIGNSNTSKLEALPVAEIIVDNNFFDYDAKYISEKTREIIPAEISEYKTKEVQSLAKMIHNKFGCDGLSRSDFILKDDRFYFLEINTLPGLTAQSICPKQANVSGMSFNEFLDKQVKLALEKNK